MTKTELRLSLLGSFRLETSDHAQIFVPAGKARGIVAYVAMQSGFRTDRGELAALLWGDHADRDARNSLSQCLFRLRRALGDAVGVIGWDRQSIWLDSGRVDVDTAALARLANSERSADLIEAANLYAGPLLNDLYLSEASFDDWRRIQQSSLAQTFEGVLHRLAERSLDRRQLDVAIAAARRAINIDPLNETAHRLLIRELAAAGLTNAALRQYDACKALLRRELDADPEPATTNIAKAVIRARVAQPISATSADARPPNAENAPPAIAVLPFTDRTESERAAYFAEGVADDLIALLSRHRWLRVVARGSSFAFRRVRRDPALVARELGVRYVLDGSAQRSGSILRLALRLILGATGEVLWADTFRRPLDELFDLESAVSRATAEMIKETLQKAETDRARRTSAANLNAWDEFQLGVWRHERFRSEDSIHARRHFRRAIEKAPEFALPYARLAHAEVSAALLGFPRMNNDDLGDELDIAKQAVALDAYEPMGRYALGRFLSRMRDHDLAIADLEKAIDLNPSFAVAHFGLAQAAIAAGRIELVLPAIEMAITLSPRDPGMWSFLSVGARALLCKGQYEDARIWASRAFELPRTEIAQSGLALVSALGHLNRHDEARRVIAQVRRARPEFSIAAMAAGPLAHFESADHRDQIIVGLRKAGLEERP